MHSATQICVKPGSEFYPYFDTIAALCNNLRNAALYRTRQVLTMVEKPFDKLTANELEVYNEIAYALPAMGDKFICFNYTTLRVLIPYRKGKGQTANELRDLVHLIPKKLEIRTLLGIELQKVRTKTASPPKIA